MRTYIVEAHPESNHWVITVPELGIRSQTRALHTAEDLARDLIALVLDTPSDTFHVRMTRDT